MDILIMNRIKNKNNSLKKEIEKIDESLSELMKLYAECKDDENKSLIGGGVMIGVEKRNKLVQEHNTITFLINFIG